MTRELTADVYLAGVQVMAGVNAFGTDRIVDLTTVSWELGHHTDHHHGARTELARLWPDHARWKLAGQLTESPVWGPSDQP